MTQTRTVILSANTAWNIINFRKPLIRALQEQGYNVEIIAPYDNSVEKLQAMNCKFHPIDIDNSGTSFKKDAKLFFAYKTLLKEINAHAFLGFTIKPNIFGGLAAHTNRTPVINNISGLGTVFIKKNWITVIAKDLYRTALWRSHTVFFQNEDDRDEFIQLGLIKKAQTALLPGSGIDLEKYKTDRKVAQSGSPKFLLIARLIWDKGIQEYVDAAQIIKEQNEAVEFQILGFLGVNNRTSVSETVLNDWVESGLINYLGSTNDVRPYIEAADCIVLPSYREGTPRSLLEAGALSRPLISTNVPGCRQVVNDGQTGFLCDVRSSKDLAEKMRLFLALSPSEKKAMGEASRKKIETEFDVKIVTQRYLEAVKSLKHSL